MEHPRSECPVACTLDLLGDKWTLLVIRDLFLGRIHFKEFLASPEGIATNILTDRLKRLQERSIVEKFPSPELKGRDAYRLTEKGRSLGPILVAVANWGLEHIEGTHREMQNIRPELV